MPKFTFTDLKIDRISDSSGVFSGTNHLAGWKHESKVNEGFGTVSGANNRVQSGTNLLIDRDLIERYAKKSNRKP